MSIARPLLVVSNVQCRLSKSRGETMVKSQRVSFTLRLAGHPADQGTGWSGILQRTRRSAEAHCRISRYFSF